MNVARNDPTWEEVKPMECTSIKERRELTSRLKLAAGWFDMTPLKGTEEEMLNAFEVLKGIVEEYRQGGDQLTENCTCGQHNVYP